LSAPSLFAAATRPSIPPRSFAEVAVFASPPAAVDDSGALEDAGADPLELEPDPPSELDELAGVELESVAAAELVGAADESDDPLPAVLAVFEPQALASNARTATPASRPTRPVPDRAMPDRMVPGRAAPDRMVRGESACTWSSNGNGTDGPERWPWSLMSTSATSCGVDRCSGSRPLRQPAGPRYGA